MVVGEGDTYPFMTEFTVYVVRLPLGLSSTRSSPIDRHIKIRSDPYNRYERTGPRRSLAFHDDILYRHYEELEAANEEYVDSPEDRLGYRQSPLGSSGIYRHSEMRTTPSKADSVILAPMIADVEKYRHSILRTPQKCTSPTAVHSLVRYHTPTRLPSFNHIIEPRTPNRRPPNMAVITPRTLHHGSAVPLLTRTPPRSGGTPPETYKSPRRASWANLPVIHMPVEMLCCVGFILLSSGAASVILAFYILAVGGRKYFLNFGAIAGFTSLVLGFLSWRTNKWKWLPHRNYLTGYILLGTFSLLNTACLGGTIYALNDESYALLDTLGGAVCGVSILIVCCSLIGVITSGCCHRPPPDNRVAHSAAGFTV